MGWRASSRRGARSGKITLLPDTRSLADPTGSGSVHQPQACEDEMGTPRAAVTLTVSWKRRSARRTREIIVSPNTSDIRPIRAETRAILVHAIALGRRWLQDIVDGSAAGPDDIAAREGCSKRHVMMMISLSFLAPHLIPAAMQGRLPRGIGVSRLTDAPIEWSRQWRLLGL